MEKDYYQILGLAEGVSEDKLKKVYRRLAKKYHPDRNNGNKTAEAKFKQISEAYETLSDPKRREEYDLMRKYGAYAGASRGGFDFAPFGGAFRDGGASFRFGQVGGLSGFEDVLGSLFGDRPGGSPFERPPRQSRVQRGADNLATLSISFHEAIHGVIKMLRPTGTNKQIKVRIPAGTDDGGKIRLKGLGQPGLYGRRNGDLIIVVRVMPDQNFKRVGNDIHSSVEISFVEAIRGCKKKVKTLTRIVSLTIPPGTQPGTKMRLKDMGLAVGGNTGDQYVEIKVTIPTTLTENQKRLLDEWEG